VLWAALNAYGVQSWWWVPFQIDYRKGSIQLVDAAMAQVICSRLTGTPGCSLHNHWNHPTRQADPSNDNF